MYIAITLLIIYSIIVTFWAAFLMRENGDLGSQVTASDAKNKWLSNNNSLLLGSLAKIGTQIQDTAKARRPK